LRQGVSISMRALTTIILACAAFGVSLVGPQATHAAELSCRLASMPDAWNADLGDLRQLATWRPGFGNSTNVAYRRGMARILDDVAAKDPAAVLVAGDLVEGHWGADVQGTRFFGKTRTLPQRRAAIRRAGAFYYGEWAER